ncbi:MAG: DUF3016 domain-containing protein, partial [Verrucomicrobiota bacterium]
MRHSLTFFFASCCAAICLSAAIETTYEDSKKFSDLEMTDRSKSTTLKLFDRELKASKTLAAIPKDGQKLSLQFTDIDMAGEILPFVGPSKRDTRVVKAIYPPRLVFNYVLSEASGEILQSGEQTLTDINFQQNIVRASSSELFYYEIKLL